jgi:hypothetical protein
MSSVLIHLPMDLGMCWKHSEPVSSTRETTLELRLLCRVERRIVFVSHDFQG